jgi:hypothetical protein
MGDLLRAWRFRVPSGDPDAIDGGSPHRITDPVGRLCRVYG